MWQVTAEADGTELVTVTSPDFAAAVFDLYVGATPVSADARTNALHAAARMMAFPGTSPSPAPLFHLPHSCTHARTWSLPSKHLLLQSILLCFSVLVLCPGVCRCICSADGAIAHLRTGRFVPLQPAMSSFSRRSISLPTQRA